jgi:hypothetical protein
VSENTFEPGDQGAPAAPEGARPQRPAVTFMGNAYDLTSLGALASGLVVLFTCLTCGTGVYCLPVVPIVMGAVGLLAARQSVDARRTRLWSWLGLGMGGLVVLAVATAIALYVGLIVAAVIASEASY